MYLLKRHTITDREKEIIELKKELKTCDVMIKSCQSLFEMTTDEYLIEARIYQLLSLSKHREYLMNCIKKLSVEEIKMR